MQTDKLKERAARIRALLLHRIYWTVYQLKYLLLRYRAIALFAMIIVLLSLTAYYFTSFNDLLAAYLVIDGNLDSLRSLFLALGSALVGAAAIAFSLVMFAMQVNVERMPHGLFRKFSSDTRLMGAFVGTFALAVCIASFSLVQDASWAVAAVLASAWGVIFVLLLFLYAYRRALLLINPLQQLSLLVKETNKEMLAWSRRAKRAEPLLKNKAENAQDEKQFGEKFNNLERTIYFRLNSHWTDNSIKAIHHAFSYAKRFVEYGDYEVSMSALNAIVMIHKSYIIAKGNTFYSNNPPFDNPLTSDNFLNDTLELLRQHVRVGIARKDEQQVEQIFRAMLQLVAEYVEIEYQNLAPSKSHANLVAAYLAEAVEAAIPYQMPDVLMEGVKFIGHSANLFAAHKDIYSFVHMVDKIGIISVSGVATEKYRPVTLSGMEQLAQLTMVLISTNLPEIKFPMGHLRSNITMVAKLFLEVPDNPLSSIHSFYLAPYYSCTSIPSFLGNLANVVNKLLETDAKDEKAKNIINNIEAWADGLYYDHRELFLLSIEKRSHFTFDVIHWIAKVYETLLTASNAPACGDITKNKLLKHARWLIATFTFVPGDRDIIKFMGTFQLTEVLLKAALRANSWGASGIFVKMIGYLLEWGFKGGMHQTGWAILENTLFGLAALSLIGNDLYKPQDLIAQVSKRLSRDNAPDKEILDRAANNLKEKAETYSPEGYTLSVIEHIMKQVDETELVKLLLQLSSLLSSATVQ